jgi:Domain of unknown function (DUF222)/HNH endonuclease
VCLTDIAHAGCDAAPSLDSFPATAVEALAAVRAGLEFLATADPAELTTDEQADCIRGLAAAEAVHVAASARMLRAFDAADGYAAYGQVSARQWLRWQTRVTKAAATSAAAWMQRLTAHPAVGDALAAAKLSPSWARAVCDWSDLLPAEHRAAADEILVEAAVGCSGLSDVRLAFERIRALCAEPDADDDDDGFAQRRLRLAPHFQGNARLDADLTPQAAAALQAVLDSLGKRTGPEDIRTRAQRDHDALEEACRRLIASNDLPDRAGQPVQIQLNMTLSQLAGAPEADHEMAAWIAAHGTPAPPGADCDAKIVPVVTGTINEDVLDQLAVGLLPGLSGRLDMTHEPALAARATRQMIVSQAVRLLSGPKGLAAWLRTRQLSGLAGSVSLPLDVGIPTETIPPHIRRAVARRDKHCRFPGCERPPAVCHVHHLIARANGGPTSLSNCVLLCPFHHLVAIHRWAWTLVLNPDGTTVATSPDGQRTLHSHAPPSAA